MNKGQRIGFIIGGSFVFIGEILALYVFPVVPSTSPHKALADVFLFIPMVVGFGGIVAGIMGGSKEEGDEK